MTVIAGAALMAPVTASAQTGIEVWNVDEDVTCDSATGGSCTFYAEGESEILAIPSNTLLSECEDELFGEMQSDGTGVIEWLGSSGGGPGCGVVNCETDDEDRWPILSTTEFSSGQINMLVRICYRVPNPPYPEIHCNLNMSIGSPGGSPHDYLFTTSTLCVNSTRKVEGDWQIEQLPLLTDELEFFHL